MTRQELESLVEIMREVCHEESIIDSVGTDARGMTWLDNLINGHLEEFGGTP